MIEIKINRSLFIDITRQLFIYVHVLYETARIPFFVIVKIVWLISKISLISFSYTGFECRCAGLFCAVHRYSDKHDCTFDYREHGAQEIRRNNPVVVGEKIQKI